jgi:hypothetical protein
METVIGVIKDIIAKITGGDFDIMAIVDMIKGLIGMGGDDEASGDEEAQA